MSTTPLSSTVLAHFYTKNEKFNFVKTIGIMIGFSGIVFLFSDNLLIDENNFLSALLILLGLEGLIMLIKNYFHQLVDCQKIKIQSQKIQSLFQ